MKILQINNCHYRRGGADVVYLNTGKLLEEKGNEVIYYSQASPFNLLDGSSTYFIDAIDFFKVSKLKKILQIPRFFYSNEAALKLQHLINLENPEVAHIHTYKGTLTPSILKILKKNKIPSVISLHDYGLICPHNSLIDGKGNPCLRCPETGNYYNCIVNKCNRDNVLLSLINYLEYLFHSVFFPFHKYFDKMIAVSLFNFNLHKKKKDLNERLVHLYNFALDIKKRHFNDKKGKYFLFYGRLSEEKGLRTLLKAFKTLANDYELLIAGDGLLKEEMLKEIEEHQLNIKYLGFKHGSELEGIIENSSFVIVPSEWYENNPLTIIEAYSFGKPVIGANIGGIPELIQNNTTGFLFESRDVTELRDKIELANKISDNEYKMMSENARAFAIENFNEDIHYEQLMSIYKSVL